MESPSAIFTNSLDFDIGTPSRLDAGSPGWSNFTPFKAFETNPFETSFDPNKPKAFTAEDIAIDCTPGGTHVFGRRKRAFSTPSLFTPGGGLDHTAFANALGDVKRPRLDSIDSYSNATSNSSSTARDRETDLSPVSSSVRTPPDSTSVPHLSLDGSFLFDGVGTAKDDSAEHDYQYQAMLDVSAPPSYHQFVLAPPPVSGPGSFGASTISPFMFNLDGSRVGCPPTEKTFPTQAQRAPTSLSGSEPSSKSKAPTKGKKGGKKARSESVSVNGEELEDADEEAKRKMFLERNRLAACKSRQKKKERVGILETQASDYAARNVALQSVAVSLREEVLALRQMLNLHDTCSCEHVGGYRARELAGGGLPTIDLLAGRTMLLDYSNVPSMGSETDVYADLVGHTDDQATPLAGTQDLPHFTTVAAKRVGGAIPRPGGVQRGPAIPLKSKKASQAPANTATNAIPVRSTSAPPRTPSWEVHLRDSYFAQAASTQA